MFNKLSTLFIFIFITNFLTFVHAKQNYRWVVKPQFEDARNVFGHSVPVKQNGKWGVISGKTGKWITKPIYEEVGAAKNAHLAVKQNGKWGFINRNGKVVIPIQYDAVQQWDKYIAVKNGQRWELITQQNQSALIKGKRLQFDKIIGTDKDCIVAQYKQHFYSILLDNGKNYPYKEKSKFNQIKNIRHAYAPTGNVIVVMKNNGKYSTASCVRGDVNQHGGDNKPRQYHDGLQAAQRNKKWGYYGIGENTNINFRFDDAKDFSSGYAPVKLGNKWGYIDTAGKMVIKPQYDKAYNFSGTIAGVRIGEQRHLITPDGSHLLPFALEDFWKNEVGIVPVKYRGKWGVLFFDTVPNLPKTVLNHQSKPEAHLFVNKLGEPSFNSEGAMGHFFHSEPVSDDLVMFTQFGDSGNEVTLWSKKYASIISRIKAENIVNTAMLLSRNIVAVARKPNYLSFYDIYSEKLIDEINIHAKIMDISISPDGSKLMAVTDKEVIIWETQTGRKIVNKDLSGQSTYRGKIFNDFYELISKNAVSIFRSFKQNEKEQRIVIPKKHHINRSSYLYGVDDIFFSNSGNIGIHVYNEYGSFQYVLVFDKQQRRFIAVANKEKYINGNEELTYLIKDAKFQNDDRLVLKSTQVKTTMNKKGFVGNSQYDDIISVIDFRKNPNIKNSKRIVATRTINQLFGDYGYLTENYKIIPSRRLYLRDRNALMLVNNAYSIIYSLDASIKNRQTKSPKDIPLAWSDGFEEPERKLYNPKTGEIFILGYGDALYKAQYPDPTFKAIVPTITHTKQQKILDKKIRQIKQAGAVDIEDERDLPVTIYTTEDGEWLIMTPEGFFDASKNGAKLLSIARGKQAFSIDQAYDKLYRPDLVAAKFNGDPNGEVARAAKTLNLGKLVASGLPPTVRFAQNTVSKTRKGNLKVSATLTDNGGGIGKLEWRVNGIVRKVQQRGLAPIKRKKPEQSVTEMLSLDPGKNVIELVAYNKAGLIVSNPATMQIIYQPKGGQGKPSLYVLAVGVNQYADSRLNLNFAEPDARAIKRAFTQGGKGLFQAVHTKLVLNKQVNKVQLNKAFTSIAKTMKPEDVFLFFIAGHGKTEDGRYYFIPHDFVYDSNASYKTNGIGQDQWQAWFAKIPAQKSVLLYDTCESGSMTKAGERGLASIERDTSFEKLRKATGRTILSATNDDAPALEGYGGHGIFTYSILEGMSNADSNGDKKVDLLEMITHITQRVPEISKNAFGFEQTPRIQSSGNSFVLTKTVQVLDTSASQQHPKKATHALQGGTKIFAKPDANSSVRHVVKQGVLYTVFVITTKGGWATVAKDGKAIGYVRHNRIVPLQ